VSTTPVTAKAVNGTETLDAAGANVAYTINEGSYSATIANFAAGDSILFQSKTAIPASISIDNSSFVDNSILIRGTFGSSSVELTLTNLTSAQDSEISFKSNFNNVFGAGSLDSAGKAPSQSIDVSPSNAAQGFGAAAGDIAFKLAEGTYSTTITGFGAGDSLQFFGSKVATPSVENTDFTDGVVLVRGSLLDGTSVEVTLGGLSPNIENKIFFASDLDRVFGVGSLIA
jgi:hypothetical protein